MNGRERIVAALRHEAVDRVPYGEFAVDYDTVARVLGRETLLRNKAGTPSRPARWPAPTVMKKVCFSRSMVSI